LFADEVYRRAFLAMAEGGGDLDVALASADPEARDVLERAAVVDVEVDAEAEARNLIAAAVRRELAAGAVSADTEMIRDDAEARVRMEALRDDELGLEAAGWLLGWLEGRMEARAGGGY
jgi:DNA primase